MSDKTKTLNESTIRRFMSLSGLKPLTENFFDNNKTIEEEVEETIEEEVEEPRRKPKEVEKPEPWKPQNAEARKGRAHREDQRRLCCHYCSHVVSASRQIRQAFLDSRSTLSPRQLGAAAHVPLPFVTSRTTEGDGDGGAHCGHGAAGAHRAAGGPREDAPRRLSGPPGAPRSAAAPPCRCPCSRTA